MSHAGDAERGAGDCAHHVCINDRITVPHVDDEARMKLSLIGSLMMGAALGVQLPEHEGGGGPVRQDWRPKARPQPAPQPVLVMSGDTMENGRYVIRQRLLLRASTSPWFGRRFQARPLSRCRRT